MAKTLNIPIISKLLYILGFFVRLLKGAGRFMFKGQISFKILVMQILFTFVEAMSIGAFLAIGIGGAVIIIVMPLLASFSQEHRIYSVLITMITRELGPLLTAFIVIARSGTAIATEIAGMVISHEIEAYISVGIDPIEHLGVPRFLGVTISVFLLNVYFSIFGLAFSFIVSMLFNSMPPSIYFNNLLHVLTMSDILLTVIKSIAFGIIISTVALYHGFAVERASTEVPVAGLRAVGTAFGWCILIDILLSAVYYMAV
ncbi:MAG: ABC transporter permease [Treponema sp.]|jgi:phospholipid/cholesterol/gamma-HCH transport system permease protein|nr:ABC transporter permease [Treponema sp.]